MTERAGIETESNRTQPDVWGNPEFRANQLYIRAALELKKQGGGTPATAASYSVLRGFTRPSHWSPQRLFLCDVYDDFLDKHKLPALPHWDWNLDSLTSEQAIWITEFAKLWEGHEVLQDFSENWGAWAATRREEDGGAIWVEEGSND